MNVSEAEIRGAERDPSSPASAGDKLPEVSAGAA
jgi:hypothetical protein